MYVASSVQKEGRFFSLFIILAVSFPVFEKYTELLHTASGPCLPNLI